MQGAELGDLRDLESWLRKPALVWWLGAVIIAIPLAFEISFSLDSKYFIDDAMIYLTYAKNIASGQGWTFNTAANDFATTSTLHTVLQTMIYYLFNDPADPSHVLFALKVFEAGVVTLGVYLFYGVMTSSGIWSIYAAFAVGLFVSARFVSTYNLFCGMETTHYLVILTAAALLFGRAKLRSVGFATGFLYLIRPDATLAGPVFALLDLGFARVSRNESVSDWFRRWLVPGAIAAGIIITVGGAFWLSKGSMLPASGEIKLITASNWGYYWTRLPEILLEFRHWLAFALLGLFSLRRERIALNALLAATLVSWLLYALIGMPRAPWYYLPFNVFFYCLVALGFQRAGDFLTSKNWSSLPVVAVVSMIFLLVDGTGIQQMRANRNVLHWHAERLQVSLGKASRWVAQMTEPDASVAAGAIGYVGYYSDRHVVDLVGLVEPAIAYANRAGDSNYWYETHKPDYAIRRMVYREQLGPERYRLIAIFGDPTDEPNLVGVFKRIDEKQAKLVLPGHS